jgi:hypothetical protein
MRKKDVFRRVLIEHGCFCRLQFRVFPILSAYRAELVRLCVGYDRLIHN